MTRRGADIIALEAAGDGRWSAPGDPALTLPHGVAWGGYTTGVLMKSVLAEPDRKGSAVAMTVTFLGRVRAAPMTIVTKRLRRGATLDVWQADLLQGDSDGLKATAVITLAERPETESFGWAKMPEVPPPEKLIAISQAMAPNRPAFLQRFESRPARGFGFRMDQFGEPISMDWARLPDGEALDAVLLAMHADRFPPRHIYHFPQPAPLAATITLNLYIHANAEEIAAVGGDYILCEATGRVGSGGLFDMQGQFWRRDGLLLATTEQLALMR